LNDLILENRKRLGEFQETQTNFEKVKLEINGLGNRITDAEKTVAEVRSLKESMSSTNEEFQKLRICLDEQNLKLDQMKLSNDELRPRLEARLDSLLSDTNKQFEKIRETQANFEKTMSELNGSFSRLSQVERSTAEITSLKEGLLANQEELRKLRASFDEQGLKLDQISLSSSQAYTRLDSATSSLGTQPITETGSTGPMSATASTPSLRRCIYCGSVLESRDRFCNRCGQPVT
jgi:chromosome segregation ATPase